MRMIRVPGNAGHTYTPANLSAQNIETRWVVDDMWFDWDKVIMVTSLNENEMRKFGLKGEITTVILLPDAVSFCLVGIDPNDFIPTWDELD